MEIAIGFRTNGIEVLTDPTVLEKIQTGCDSSLAAQYTNSLSHVVELYDFPPSLKTSDLDAVLHKFKLEKYYELIWVDDTHALAVMVSTLKPFGRPGCVALQIIPGVKEGCADYSMHFIRRVTHKLPYRYYKSRTIL